MNYIFDSSGIFSAMALNIPEKLLGNYTLDLARYELGNIVWKEHYLHKRIAKNEETKLLDSTAKVLGGMRTLKIDGCENLVLEVADQFGCSFYDAAYVYFAKVLGVPMVTKDIRLVKKIGDYIRFADTEAL